MTSSEIQPVALFQGYDTFTNTARSTAVQGVSEDAGGTINMYYQVCVDLLSLQQALNVSASVNASFGFGDVGGKSGFIQELNITNTAVTIVVYKSRMDTKVVTNVTGIENAPTDIGAFYEAYGDSYVAKLVTGAEYGAVYVFYSQTSEEQTEVRNTLSINGISESGSVDATLQANLKKTLKQVSMRQAFNQFQNGYRNLVVPAVDDVISFALKFGTDPADDPVVISYGVVGYEHVSGMPPSFLSVAATRTLFSGAGSQPGLAGQYAWLQASSNAVSAIKQVYETYGYSGDKLLGEKASIIEGDIATLDALFQDLATDPTKSYSSPGLKGLGYGTPYLNVTINNEGPYGGPGGSPFQFQPSTDSVAQSLLLTNFSVSGDAWVDRIVFQYTSDAGDSPLYIQGGDGGTPSPEILLAAAERIVSVRGHYGEGPGGFVADISLTTTRQTFTTWPPTSDGGKAFTWSAQGSTVFLGFAGRSGEYLDQLQIVTATFQPAKWQPYITTSKY